MGILFVNYEENMEFLFVYFYFKYKINYLQNRHLKTSQNRMFFSKLFFKHKAKIILIYSTDFLSSF